MDWWFYLKKEEELWLDSKKQSSIDFTKFKDDHYAKGGLKSLIDEADKWEPFNLKDGELLQNTDSSEVVVKENKLSIVEKVNMTMAPIYWDGAKVPVRVTKWFLHIVEKHSSSFIPLPKIWEDTLEKAFNLNYEWIKGQGQSGDKIETLSRPFHTFLISFSKNNLSECSLIFEDQEEDFQRGSKEFKLIRGYDNLIKIRSLGIKSELSEGGGPTKHLILAVHGIGQKFAGKMGHGFISDVNNLRGLISQSLVQKGEKSNFITILPVCWRISSASAKLNDQVQDFDEMVQKITLDSVPLFRSVISDAALDILLYMSPYHSRLIKTSILSEVNRLLELFRKYNPSFSIENGCKIHIFAHSLGSALVSDILFSSQPPEFPLLSNIFAVGSPIALFELLKEETCLKMPEGKHPQCSIYNIFHPADPIAYRLEPLLLRNIQKASNIAIEPAVPLPSSAGLVLNLIKKFTNKFKRSSPLLSSNDRESGETEKQSSETNPLYRFNRRGRVDYVIQQSIFEYDYLTSLRAHFCYWWDKDVALFVINEILHF
jgi:hypothetical protein